MVELLLPVRSKVHIQLLERLDYPAFEMCSLEAMEKSQN